MGFCGLNKQTCLQRCKFHKECPNRSSCLSCFRWKCFLFFHHTVAHLSYCVWLNAPDSHFTIWSKSHLDEKQRRKASRTAEERSEDKVGVKGRAAFLLSRMCWERLTTDNLGSAPKGCFFNSMTLFFIIFSQYANKFAWLFFFFLDIV